MAQIECKNIVKTFDIYKPKRKGILSLFNRNYEKKYAVNDISFEIEEGEKVGYIGANGAGKSTTIKMLSGVLVPSDGEINVLGLKPYENREKNAINIGVVFGQRTQLFWDLPLADAFELYKRMYKVSDETFTYNKELFSSILDLNSFYDQPVRQLSLGQKMRADFAIALLHDPKILYLDEPTIGLDVLAKSKIRNIINEINKRKKTTIILTTHDMDDIDTVCERIILIDKGKKIYDGKISDFRNFFGSYVTLTITVKDENICIENELFDNVVDRGLIKHITFDTAKLSKAKAISYITRNLEIEDIVIKETSIEDVVKNFYNK